MARARNIKPGFFTNDVLGELEPLARLLFAGLWCHADRAGRLEDRPKKLKAEILPYDNCDVNGLIQCLHSAGMVLRYVVDGKAYIQILKFDKHQNPHVKEAESQIPAPTDTIQEQCEHSINPADSLNLIPDSLNPSTTLSGTPDVPEFPKDSPKKLAIEILEFLNEKTGRKFEPLPANLDLIKARLREASEDDIRSVIVVKCRQWLPDEKMAQYLRPATLFNRAKFAQYLGELSQSAPPSNLNII